MDETIFLFLALIVLGGLVLAIVLPIVALAVSLRTRRKVDAQLSGLQSGQSQLAPDSLQQVVQQLTQRVARLEAALLDPSVIRPQPHPRVADRPVTEPGPRTEPSPQEQPRAGQTAAAPPVDQPQPTPSFAPHLRLKDAAQLESLIGRRLIGWVSICLILFAAAFFLKYAFDNRWIGELGRVAI